MAENNILFRISEIASACGLSGLILRPYHKHPRDTRQLIEEFLKEHPEAKLVSEERDEWYDYHDSRSYDKWCECDQDPCQCDFSESDPDDIDLCSRIFIIRWAECHSINEYHSNDDLWDYRLDLTDYDHNFISFTKKQADRIVSEEEAKGLNLVQIMEKARQTSKEFLIKKFQERVSEHQPKKTTESIMYGWDVDYDYNGPKAYEPTCQDYTIFYYDYKIFNDRFIKEKWIDQIQVPTYPNFWTEIMNDRIRYHSIGCRHQRIN